MGADLLTQASREILVHMVGIIFSRLGDLPVLDLSAEETLSLAHSPRLAVRSPQKLSQKDHVELCFPMLCTIVGNALHSVEQILTFSRRNEHLLLQR